MTPLEKIKEGITEADMKLVIEGYIMMTGDESVKAKPKRKKAAKRKAVKKKATKRKKTTARKTTKKGSAIKFQENLFDSMMGYAEDLTEAEQEDMEKFSVAKLDKYQGIKVTCAQCNKNEEVHPSRVIPGSRFFCDKCLETK
jgi:hypothetical protein